MTSLTCSDLFGTYMCHSSKMSIHHFVYMWAVIPLETLQNVHWTSVWHFLENPFGTLRNGSLCIVCVDRKISMQTMILTGFGFGDSQIRAIAKSGSDQIASQVVGGMKYQMGSGGVD